MIDVFHAIAACDDLIRYWDVAKHPDGGVLLRASSQRWFPTERQAVDSAGDIVQRLRPDGYDARMVNATARTNGRPSDGWHAFVEVLIGVRVGTVTS